MGKKTRKNKIFKISLIFKKIGNGTLKLIFWFYCLMLLFSIFWDWVMKAVPREHYTIWQLPLAHGILIALMIFLFYFYAKNKNLILVFFLLLTTVTCTQLRKLPDLRLMDDIDFCLEAGYCTVYAYPDLTLEGCLFKSGVWNLDAPACDYRFDSKDCYKKKGNWIYPDICKKL